MQITILRHGEPDLPEWGKIPSSTMPKWIKSYNSSGVKNELPALCQQLLQKSTHNFIVCSNLERSIHTAKIIGHQPNKIDTIFREAELPIIQLPLIKLTPHQWNLVFRLFWLAGFSSNIESLKLFKRRVANAADDLNQLSKTHNSILFIGHGIFNRFLAQVLICKGWSGEEAANGKKYWGYQYWEYANYTKIK